MSLCDFRPHRPAAVPLWCLAVLALLTVWTAPAAFAQDEPIVQDGSFEDGVPNEAWDEFSNGPGGTPICSGATCGGGPNGAFEGDWWLWFGRGTDNKIASVSQDVVIPDTITTLSFYLQIPEADKPGTLRVQIGGATVFQATENDAGDYEEYEQVLVDVSALADGTTSRTLTFLGVIGASPDEELVSLFVDQVSFETIDSSAPSFSVDPATLSFTVQEGEVSDDQTLTLSNDGDGEGTYSISTVILPEPRSTSDVPAYHREGAAKTLRGPVPPTAGTPWRGGDIVADGSFEGGSPNASWDEFSSNFGTPLCTNAVCSPASPDPQPRTGTWWAWFGGANAQVGFEEGSIEQSVTIPDGEATLVFWLRITGTGPGSLDVLVDGDNLFGVTEADAASYEEYTEVTVDLSKYADGESHTLRFESEQDGNAGIVNFFVDDVSIAIEGGGGDPLVLNVDPESGTVASEDSEEISVTVDATDAEPGTYQGQIVITTDDEDTPEIVVDVTIVVSPVVANEDGLASAGFTLRPSYPNPFAARTTLRYDLPEAATVRVEVYDVTGRRVATLVDAPQAAGTYELEWDAAGLPSGVYIYQVEAGSFSETQQITLVR